MTFLRPTLAAIAGFAAAALASAALAAPPAPAYAPIQPDLAMASKTVVLTGRDLSIDDVIAVARYGARVRFSPEAIAQAEAGAALMREADAEGISMYATNRGAGALREVKVQMNKQPDQSGAKAGARFGALPEISEEELVRAFLVIQANHIPYNAATAEYMNAVTDLLNHRVTPVMYSRGSLGEGDLFLTSNYNATLVGRGDAYFEGQRMSAAQALAKAGLKPIAGPTGGGTTNAYATAIAALLVTDARDALEWADLTLAFDYIGMNSSLTPLTPPVTARRPFTWVSWEAAKELEIVRGSYLFQEDPTRILQDAESLRASYSRLGSAWQAWATLRDAVAQQINSGEQNPAIFLDVKPTDAWSLATPWVAQYHVRGGPLSNGRSGYVMSNANWDPYPMTNEVEAFNLAFANMAVTVANRIDRFSDRGPTAFFTGIKPSDVVDAATLAQAPMLSEAFFTYLDVWKELQVETQSVPPDSAGVDFGVADIDADSRLKATHGREAVDLFMQLMAYDVVMATNWMDIRKAQDPKRDFGGPATAAWTAYRKVVPWKMAPDQRPDVPYGVLAYEFMKANPARKFMPNFPALPTQPVLNTAK